jgi:hypothetical protein
MFLRPISFPTHGALELAAGLAVGIVPVAIGVPPAGIIAAVFLGATMIGLALGASAPSGSARVPIRAHASYDKLLAGLLLATAIGAGIAGNPGAFAFFAAAAAGYTLLIVATRYTAPA